MYLRDTEGKMDKGKNQKYNSLLFLKQSYTKSV